MPRSTGTPIVAVPCREVHNNTPPKFSRADARRVDASRARLDRVAAAARLL